MNAKTYKVNEIFLSVQAEGRNAGRAAVFVRFSGCNLKCPFCDTNHEPFIVMTGEEIDVKISELDPSGKAIVVFTGGEPTLQIDNEHILAKGRFTTIETNGINHIPEWISWVTISPKTILDAKHLANADELKILWGWFDNQEEYFKKLTKEIGEGVLLYLQPTADASGKFNPLPVVEFIKKNPEWRLSLQFHKLFDIR